MLNVTSDYSPVYGIRSEVRSSASFQIFSKGVSLRRVMHAILHGFVSRHTIIVIIVLPLITTRC